MHSLSGKQILPVIVIAQFSCTSVWFAGNAVIAAVIKQFSLTPGALGHLVSAVQLGFISGTLLFAVFTVSDRFSPSRVFFICAIAASVSNLLIFLANGLPVMIASRFATGLFLAGIYPVGMKIAADYHKEGLGKALGWLVGALVIGTAFPHLLRGLTQNVSWKWVMMVSSGLSVLGGCMILWLVPDGPYRRQNTKPDLVAFTKIFRNKDFRSAAFGYFGHMWELYAFWAFVPVIITTYINVHPFVAVSIPILSFLIIGVGSIACVMGGYFSQSSGSAKTAFTALAVSFFCCLYSPFLFQLSLPVFVLLMIVWGMAVIADSPQFSTLVAHSAEAETKGTALTITNSIGFFITIISIETINFLRTLIHPENVFLVLSIGPLFGLIAMSGLVFTKVRS